MNNKKTASGRSIGLHEQAAPVTRVESIVAPVNQDALSPEESGQLLHELRVQQIELEMQNDELRRTHAELDASRARYFNLFDLAPVGYLSMSEKGLILEANLAAAALLEVTRGVLAGQPLTRYILPEDMDLYSLHRKKLFDTGKPQTCELRLLRADNTPFWAQLDATATNDAEAATAYQTVIIDITERKQLEDAQLFLLQFSPKDSGAGFFKSLARYLARNLKMDYVCIDRLEGEGLSAHTVAIYFDGNFEDNVTYPLKDTPCGEVVGRTICCFESGVRHLFPQDALLQEMRAESYAGTTLWSFDEKPIGLIAVIGRRPLENRRLAESLLKMTAVRAAGELERQQALEAITENEKNLQKSHEVLEDRVKERTQALFQNNALLLKEIEDRLQAEQALKESEERYRSIFHNHHAIMLLIDPETQNIEDANPAACSFYGYTRDELIAKKISDLSMLPPDSISRKITLALSTQQNHFYFPHRLSSGQVREVEVFVCSVRIKGKAFLFSVIHDISERRQMEQRIVEVSELIQKIFDASPLGILAYEISSGQCVMVNEAAARIIGASHETVLRQNFNHLESWKTSGLLTAALEVIQTNQPRENIELHLVTTFGSNVSLNCSLIPFSSAKKPHLLLMGQDISQQKLADAALRQNQKLAAIGLLVAGIAHEINNPNGFIIFNLPILRDYLQEMMPIVDDFMTDHPDRGMFGRPYEDFRTDLFKLLDNVEHGAHRINATVSGLKEFSGKREKLEPRRVALKPVIENAVSFCRGEIRKNVKSLHLDIPDNLPLIRTDPDAVEQILVNLLINAALASDKADSWIRLSVTADSGKPDRCIILVDDNGCGMDEKTLKRVFDPFYTSKPSHQGTGLGLYICQNLAEGLGGRIEVRSRPDQGSSFKLILNDF